MNYESTTFMIFCHTIIINCEQQNEIVIGDTLCELMFARWRYRADL